MNNLDDDDKTDPERHIEKIKITLEDYEQALFDIKSSLESNSVIDRNELIKFYRHIVVNSKLYILTHKCTIDENDVLNQLQTSIKILKKDIRKLLSNK